MSYKKLKSEGFYRDEDGKWHIVPMKLPEEMRENAKKSSEKKPPGRKFIPIERLKITPIDENVPVKRQKIDKTVRKELFKVPLKKNNGNRLSFNTRQSKNFGSNRKSRIKTTVPKISGRLFADGSPLLDIDEAEELLQKNSLALKPAEIPIITLTKAGDTITGHTPIKIDFPQESTTPESGKSDKEFIEIEKTLSTLNETNKIDSPMSSVCTLLQKAKINSSGGKSEKKQNQIILTNIKTLIERDKREYEALNKHLATFFRNHEENYKTITNLLSQLEDGDNDKENMKRRSNRIAAQATVSSENTKFVISPAISKKVDLRKSTLNKNLTKTLQMDVESPRTKKAVDLYNSIRNDCGVLCTPKLDRTAINVQQVSVTRSLSRRIQKQCLLLQETPKPAV